MLKKYLVSVCVILSIMIVGGSFSLATSKDNTDGTEQTIEETTEETKVSNSEEQIPKTMARALDVNEKIVYSYDELAATLSGANGYTHIYLGADIIQSSSNNGIVISPSKPAVIIDGLSPETNKVYTFTQYGSTAQSRTILVDTSNKTTKNVTLQNINTVGNNYYGIVSVQSSSTRRDVTLSYINMTHVGSQITYNEYGTAIYKNTDITITDTSSISSSNELAEVNRVVLSGNVNINRTSNSNNAVFWLKDNTGDIVVSENANVVINTKHYFIYGTTPKVTLESNSKLDYTGGTHGLTYDAQNLQNLSIGKGAYLGVKQVESASTRGLIRLNESNSFKMEEDASLILDGVGPNNIGIYSPTTLILTFNNPKRVKIHMPSKQPFYTDSSIGGSVEIITDAINLWPTATISGTTINTAPNKMWNKALNQKLSMKAFFKKATVYSMGANNLDAGDPTSDLTKDTFTLHDNELITFGQLPLQTDPITNVSKQIRGVTEDKANINISYNSLNLRGTAVGGVFSVLIISAPTVGQNVRVKSYFDTLNKVEDIIVLRDSGSLKLKHVPPSLNYGTQQIPGTKQIYMPLNTEQLYVEVEDTRVTTGSWNLKVSSQGINSSLGKSENIKLVYVNNAVNKEITTSPTSVMTGSGNSTSIWNSRLGVGLNVTPGQIFVGETYTGTLKWSLEDVP